MATISVQQPVWKKWAVSMRLSVKVYEKNTNIESKNILCGVSEIKNTPTAFINVLKRSFNDTRISYECTIVVVR